MERAEDLPSRLRPCGKVGIELPSGSNVELPICKPIFKPWTGAPVLFDYGGKQVLDHEAEACFAELAILRILLSAGWDGVWVEVFGGPNYLRTMPDGWKLKTKHVTIPAEKEALLRKIWSTAKSYACFDVFAWKGEALLFCEAKRVRRDRLTKPQLSFIEGAIACGIRNDELLIVEWTLSE